MSKHREDIREDIADLIADHCERDESCKDDDCSQCKAMLFSADKIITLFKKYIEGAENRFFEDVIVDYPVNRFKRKQHCETIEEFRKQLLEGLDAT